MATRLRVEHLEERLGPAIVAEGFTESVLAVGLNQPTAMVAAPDGRIFVTQQTGEVRVVQNGRLSGTPALRLPVRSNTERGLLGIALDPAFTSNQFVYLYYSATVDEQHRVSRFTMNGNTLLPQSERMLLAIPDSPQSSNHNGGALAFGKDGKLYIAVGDDALPTNAQQLDNLHGKVLRINSDGSIPQDNPFYTTALGDNRAIWALGLRNPFTIAAQLTSGRIFINDVGQDRIEELNEGGAGRNFGWPATEGPFSTGQYPGFINPIFNYQHGPGNHGGFAISGGVFYPSTGGSFPADYNGDYFFADFINRWIRRRDGQTGAVELFAVAMPVGIVDLDVATDGSLLVLSYYEGSITRVEFPNGVQPPRITQSPTPVTISLTQSTTFSVGATGTGPLTYQWQRNNVNIPKANGPTYTVNDATLADHAARYRCVVTNRAGQATSGTAILSVLNNHPPVPVVLTPIVGTRFGGGDTIAFTATATDIEEGTIDASRMTWQVQYITGGVARPFVMETAGNQGSFTIPTLTPYTRTDVLMRITVSARDGSGATAFTTFDLPPRLTTLTLATEPSGLGLLLDGQPLSTPAVIETVAGYTRELAAPTKVTRRGVPYIFDAWTDGTPQTHAFTVTDAGLTATAVYIAQAPNQIATLVGNAQTSAGGGTHANFNTGTANIAFTVAPFGANFRGGVRTATGDITGDGVADLIAASGPGRTGQVIAYDGVTQQPIWDITPFGGRFTRGINIASGDLTGDGKSEVIITAESGGGARVRIFSPVPGGMVQLSDFIALIDGNGAPATSFRGGARTAVGDFNADGVGDLVFAAGAGGGPRVALFDGITLNANGGVKLRGDFFAAETVLTNGTYVAAGDFDGDGHADLVVAAAPGGGPRVTIFSGLELLNSRMVKLEDFFVGPINSRKGLRVAVKNLDGDGLADIVVRSGEDGTIVQALGAAMLDNRSPIVPTSVTPIGGRWGIDVG